jgi:gluconolactonase
MAGSPKRFATGFQFVEGPTFDSDGNLFVVNLKGGTISKITPRKKVTTFVDTSGGPNGQQFDSQGHLFVCDVKHRAILQITPDGIISQVVTEDDEGEKLAGPNDITFAEDGGYYFTDPEGSNLENAVGSVYHVDAGGNVTRIAAGLAYPNGLVVSEDGRRLYVAETMTRRIHAYALRPDGSSAAARIHAELPEGGVGPDGMALDVEGNLYVAYYGAGTVCVFDRWGGLKEQIPAGGKNPTNVAFGGKNNQSLYVTETETDAVYVLKCDIPGLPTAGQV